MSGEELIMKYIESCGSPQVAASRLLGISIDLAKALAFEKKDFDLACDAYWNGDLSAVLDRVETLMNEMEAEKGEPS